MDPMFVEGYQGDPTWWTVIKVGVVSLSFIWILIQRSGIQIWRAPKYNKETALKKAQARQRVKNSRSV